jgi:hypothetical protein
VEIGHIIQKICELTKIIDKSDEKGIIKAKKRDLVYDNVERVPYKTYV